MVVVVFGGGGGAVFFFFFFFFELLFSCPVFGRMLKICWISLVLMNNVLLNLLCVWILSKLTVNLTDW